MAKKPSLEVAKESETGLNTRFQDNKTGENISRSEAVKRVEEGKHPDFISWMMEGRLLLLILTARKEIILDRASF